MPVGRTFSLKMILGKDGQACISGYKVQFKLFVTYHICIGTYYTAYFNHLVLSCESLAGTSACEAQLN